MIDWEKMGKRFRKCRGKSALRDMEKKLPFSYSKLSTIENGRVPIDLEDIFVLARRYKKPVSFFLHGVYRKSIQDTMKRQAL